MDPPRVRRARAFNRPGALIVVALFLLLAFVAFITFGVSLAMLMTSGEAQWGIYALCGLGVFAISRAVVFALSRSLTCPLCHGTVMHEKRCRKHAEAFRLRPFSYRASVVLSLLCSLTFRCMYCGTGFRLKR